MNRKNRDIFLPSLTTMVICSMMLFLSCAHKAELDQADWEKDLENSEEVVAEGAATEGENAEGTPTGEETVAENSADTLAEPKTEETPAAGDELGLNELTEEAPAAEAPSTDETTVATNETTQNEELAVPTEGNNEVVETTPDHAAFGEGDSTLAELEAPEPTAPMVQEEAKNEPAPSFEPQGSSGIPSTEAPSMPSLSASPTPEPVRVAPAPSRVPEIPRAAFEKNGQNMNRFYMVRNGDTPSSVADLLYGDEGRSNDLMAWNGGASKFKVGKVLYYHSPTQPQDGEMRSFFQERSVTPETYRVGGGDWLSKIAQKRLGHPGSWTEVAIVNGLEDADRIERGQELVVYPKNLDSYRFTQQVVANNAPERQPEPEQLEPAPQVNNQANTQLQPSQPPVVEEMETIKPIAPQQPPVVKAPAEPMKELLPQDFDPQQFFEQNLIFIVLGGAVFILLLALMSIRRKKKTRQGNDDDLDESFTPPTKFKRN